MSDATTRPGSSPIDLQIMWNRLIAVVEEQGRVLIRTAFSSIVRECGDISAGVFDTRGRMLAQAVTGTPGHVNSMAESVKHFIRAFPVATMKEGDTYICNDPWLGTGHLNDFVVTTPVFLHGRLVALFSCTSHIVDIGGINGPDAADVFMEGLYIPMLRLVDRGVVNETLMAMIRANTRLPVDTVGDTYSLAGCNDVGARRLVEMMGEFGIDSLDELAEHIITRSRAAVLAEIAALPRGSWSYAMTADGYDGPLPLRARLTVSADRVHVDYTGTAGPLERGINVPLAYTTAYTVFGLGCIVSSRIPNNAGSLEPLTVWAPPDTILKVLDNADAPTVLMPADAYPWQLGHPVSYFKGAYGMVLLREQILGKERFDWAFRKYIRDWAFRHPSPSDFFRAMDSEGGEELDWFWRGWYMNNWRYDVAAGKIDGEQVTLVNHGQLVLPTEVEVRYTDGTTTRFRVPVEAWESKGEVTWVGEKPVSAVTVDPDHMLPDDDRANNTAGVK